MGLIKSTNAPATLSPFSMKNIEQQARAMLMQARGQADQLLAAAQAEADQLKEEARAEGLAAGHREGLAKGTEQGRQAGHQQALNEHKAQLTQLVKTITNTLNEFNTSRQKLEAGALVEVVELAIAIARRVTKRQAAIDPAVLADNLSQAMKLVVHASDIIIAIHPDQKKTLVGELPRLQLVWPALEHVQLTEDPTLSLGSCRIITAQGQIEAELDHQLDRIVAELLPAPEEPA